MALALYRKYRPATFAEVVGQEHVTDPLRTALESGRINHAYLFSGPRGCGKTSSARILARSLNCVEGPTPEPCGVCASCVSLAPGGPGNIDVTELDAASHGGVDDTRELRDRAFFAPAESRYRVFIVDEAHMITTQGFNALLKIVEEPPEHLVFVFATTEPEKVLPTIRSRTHHYPFRLIPPGTLRKLLERICAEEGVTVAAAVYPLVIRAGGGSARDSLSVLDQLVSGAGPEGVTYERAMALLGVTDVSLIDDVVDALAAGDRAAVFESVDRLVEAGHDPRRFAADLLQRLRDLTLLQAVPEAVERGLVEAADDEIARMVEQSGRFGAATLTRYGEILHTGLTEMRGATAPRLLLELLCARMLLPAATAEDAGLLERLERLERRSAIAATPPAPGEAGDFDDAERRFERPSAAGGRSEGRSDPAPDHKPVSQPEVTPASGVPVERIGTVPRTPVSSSGSSPGAGATPGRRGDARGPAGADRTVSATAESATGRSTAGGSAVAGPVVVGSDGLGSDPAGSGLAGSVVAGSDTAGRRDDGGAEQASAASPRPEPTTAPVVAQVGAVDVRRVWQEIQDAVKQRKKRTAALLVSATVRAVENETLVLAIGTAPLARLLSEQSNTDVIAEALHAVLGVRWRVRCEHGDAPPPSARAPEKAPEKAPEQAPEQQARGASTGSGAASSSGAGGKPEAPAGAATDPVTAGARRATAAHDQPDHGDEARASGGAPHRLSSSADGPHRGRLLGDGSAAAPGESAPARPTSAAPAGVGSAAVESAGAEQAGAGDVDEGSPRGVLLGGGSSVVAASGAASAGEAVLHSGGGSGRGVLLGDEPQAAGGSRAASAGSPDGDGSPETASAGDGPPSALPHGSIGGSPVGVPARIGSPGVAGSGRDLRGAVLLDGGAMAGGPTAGAQAGVLPGEGSTRTGRPENAGRPRFARRSARTGGAGGSDDGVPLPPEPPDEDLPPDDQEAMLAELDAGEAVTAPAPADPEQTAMALLTTHLGARAIDRR